MADKDYINNLISKYENLRNALDNEIKNMFKFVIEIVMNTKNEICNIEDTMKCNEPLGKINAIKLNKGDVHCGGKTVAFLYFEKGLLVYKPRNMNIDRGFQMLLQWFNHKIGKDEFRLMNIHSIQSAGWAEFIKNRDCDNAMQVKKFYERSGAYLSILYALNAVDFHYENIIACGEHPVLVDLESILHITKDNDMEAIKEGALGQAIHYLNTSVSQIGMLPHKIEIGKGEDVKSLEVGGLSNVDNQKTPSEKYFCIYRNAKGGTIQYLSRIR